MDKNLQPSDEYFALYDKSELTYANSFPQFYKRWFIKSVEWLTARVTLYRKMQRFEGNRSEGAQFWQDVLDEMNIELSVSTDDYQRIPRQGPLVVVANHPHGLIDGIVMGAILSKVRDDYQILTRALLVGVKRVEKYLLPVAFPHEENAVRRNVEMRQRALQTLKNGHVIALFPAGTVSTSRTFFGKPIEPEWATFTAKMIQQSGARVLPVYFTGSNTRLFQIANLLSDTLRQSLLLYEIKAAFNRAQSPVIGEVIDPAALAQYKNDRQGLMNFLREETLRLGPESADNQL